MSSGLVIVVGLGLVAVALGLTARSWQPAIRYVLAKTNY